MNLTIFEALVITHFVMDWLFQTKWEADNKSKKWLPLFVHSSIYTLGFIPVFFWYQIGFSWLALLFLSHVFLDRRPFEIWWLKTVKRFTKENAPEWFWFMLLIAVDQTFHILVLTAIILFR